MPTPLQVWLLFVLAAEAPAVAGQILCTRQLAGGRPAAARALLLRLLRMSAGLGALAASAMLLLAGPATAFFFPLDAATAAVTRGLFRYAALVSTLVPVTIVCESVLLGAGSSYGYLATATLANALAVSTACGAALRLRPAASSAWACIVLFFVLRLAAASSRIFLTERGGYRRPSAEAQA